MLVDLHIRTVASGGTQRLDEVFEYARAYDLHAFSVTNHEPASIQPIPPDLVDRYIPGAEVEIEIAGNYAQLLVYGSVHRESRLWSRLTAQPRDAAPADEIIAAAHEAGVLTVLAHPLTLSDLVDMDRLRKHGLDGIEVWHPTATPDEAEGLRKYARRHGLVATAGCGDAREAYGAAPFDLPVEDVVEFFKRAMQRVAESRCYESGAKVRKYT